MHNAAVAVVDETRVALVFHMIDSLQPPWFMPRTDSVMAVDGFWTRAATVLLVIPAVSSATSQGRVTSVQLNNRTLPMPGVHLVRASSSSC